jgi:hypothetical protein
MEESTELMNTVVRINEQLTEIVGMFDSLLVLMRDFTVNYNNASTEVRQRKINQIRTILRDMEQKLNVA